MQTSRTGRTIANIVIGTLVGAGVALLFAPKSGRQIRKDIVKQAHQLTDQASKLTDTAAKVTMEKAKSVHMPDISKHMPDISKHMPDISKMTNRHKRESGTGKMLIGILIGSVVGVGAALLFAPKSGQQMREQLRREADELGSRASNLARETADQVRNRTRDVVNEAEGEMKRQKEIMEDVNNRDFPL